MYGSPAAIEFRGKLLVVYQASSSDISACFLLGYKSNDNNLGNSPLWYDQGQIKTSTGSKIPLHGTPALAVFNNLLYMVYQSKSGNGQLLYATFDGTSWSDGNVISGVALNPSSAPAAISYNGSLYVVYQDSQADNNNHYSLNWLTFDGSSWSSATAISTSENSSLVTNGFPSLMVFNGLLYMVYPATSNPPYLWTSGFDGTSWSPVVQINSQITGAPSISMYNCTSFAYAVFQGTGDSEGELFYRSLNGYKVDCSVPLLDVWGEGRIVDVDMVTGFEDALNLNNISQQVSNGANSYGAILRMVPINDYNAPKFPISDGLVSYITLMGAPITTDTAKEMYRVLNKNTGVVILYNPAEQDKAIFEANMGALIYKPDDPLNAPFNQINMSPEYIYGFPGVNDHDEL